MSLPNGPVAPKRCCQSIAAKALQPLLSTIYGILIKLTMVEQKNYFEEKAISIGSILFSDFVMRY